MSVRYVLDPVLTPDLEAGLAQLWADVTNAGGAVGFVPPVTTEDVRPELKKHLVAVAQGHTRPLVGRDARGRVQTAAFFTFNTHRLKRHWVGLSTVMVHPDCQGRGVGRELMATVEQAARGLDGITGILLTCRGGLGLERFYTSCGYRETGRVPGAIKVAEDDLRDDVTLWLPLR